MAKYDMAQELRALIAKIENELHQGYQVLQRHTDDLTAHEMEMIAELENSPANLAQRDAQRLAAAVES